MPRTRAVESRRDRLALAEDAGLGRISLASVLAGMLVAFGAFAILLSIAGAVAAAVGVDTDLSANDWRELGVASAVVVAVLLFLSWLYGGYVAGRMARRAGMLNGLVSLLVGVAVVVVLGAVLGGLSGTETFVSNLRSLGVPTTGEEWGDIGTAAGLGSIAAMVLGSLLGGILGERWHARLLSRALDPEVGAEARARRKAEASHEAAEWRHDTASERVSRAQGQTVDLTDQRAPTEENQAGARSGQSEPQAGGRSVDRARSDDRAPSVPDADRHLFRRR